MAFLRSLGALLAAAALFATPAAAVDLGSDDVAPVRLNASITVTGADVRLGDVFSGLTSYRDRVVAHAPRPGQREVMSAEFLTSLARTYGFDWRPGDAFDRAVVFRPGQNISPTDMLAAAKADLQLKGLPANFGLRPASPLPTLTVPADTLSPVIVREAFYDPATKAFSAVLELAGDSGPQFLQMRGVGFATVSVPVLKTDAGRTTVITAEMIEQAEVPQEQVKNDIVTDVSLLVGKTPRGFVQAHRPIHDTEVGRVTLVDVPVLKSEMKRDGVIHDTDIVWTTFNAIELPSDAVVNKEYLIGKSPRSFVAGGSPIRRGDVLSVRQVQMAVATRDLGNGAVLQKGDINWVSVGDNEIENGAITSEALLNGRATTRPIRAGQTLRAIDVVRPTVVNRGKLVTIVYAVGGLKLTVQGEAKEDGGLSETIHVANVKSQTIVLAEVMDASTVRVTSQQSAMQ